MRVRAILLGPCWGNRRQQKQLKRRLDEARIQSTDLLVGIDGGTLYWLKHGYQPTFAVGDWDSFAKPERLLRQLRHVSLPAEKDRSDLFFAVVAAIGAGATDLLCLGVTGGRPDHHLATLMDLSLFAEGRYGKLQSVQAIGIDGEFIFLSTAIPRWQCSFSIGQLVSLFSMTPFVEGLTLIGFRYPLKNVKMVASSWGLSNQAQKRKCEVRLRKGKLLVIIPHNESASGEREERIESSVR